MKSHPRRTPALEADEKPTEPEARKIWQERQQQVLALKAEAASDAKRAESHKPVRATAAEARYKPLYVIDHAALQSHPNPIGVVEHLVDCIVQKKWRREPLCRACNRWEHGDGLSAYPHRPGAWMTSHVSCNGCWYSYLDDVRQLERAAKRRSGRSRPIHRGKKKAAKVQPKKAKVKKNG